MDTGTETTRAAARSMLTYSRDELSRDLISEGPYHTVVEGGYHTETLTDDEADFLAELLVERGINGLEAYANAEQRDGDRRDIAQITPLVSTSGNAFEELIDRLDDGNAYPGFYLDHDQASQTYTLYEEGYSTE